MYRAIERFADLEDGKHIYGIGEPFPRKGYEPTDERLKELSGSDNKVGKPVIQYFDDPKVETSRPDSKKKQKK